MPEGERPTEDTEWKINRSDTSMIKRKNYFEKVEKLNFDAISTVRLQMS